MKKTITILFAIIILTSFEVSGQVNDKKKPQKKSYTTQNVIDNKNFSYDFDNVAFLALSSTDKPKINSVPYDLQISDSTLTDRKSTRLNSSHRT
mgnify:CR=1 FL=1